MLRLVRQSTRAGRTNHHCVLESIQYHSKEGQDYLTDGFLAKSPG
ncbi:S46 family peptidase [Mesorhizobium sp. M0601]